MTPAFSVLFIAPLAFLVVPRLRHRRLDLDGHMRPGCVHHGVHAIHHCLLQPAFNHLGIPFVALDDDLVVHGEDRHSFWALGPTLP